MRELKEVLGIPQASVLQILVEDLRMKRVAAKTVARLLSQKQKQVCAEVGQNLVDLTVHRRPQKGYNWK